MNSQNKIKNNQIQFLRGLFCLIIMIYHYTYRYSEIYGIYSVFDNSFFGLLGHIGIVAFFLISGLFIDNKSSLNKKETFRYWFNRVFQIYVIYIIALVIIFLFSFTGLYGSERTVLIDEFILNFFFVNNIIDIKSVDGAHWFIFVLFILYFWSFISNLLKTKYKVFYWLILLFINLLCLVISKIDSIIFINKSSSLIYYLTGTRYLPIFTLSIFTLYFVRNKNFDSRFFFLLGILLCVINLTLIDYKYLIICFITLPIIILAFFQKLKIIEKFKPLVILGNMSLSFYLIHQNIGYLFINLLSKSLNYYLSLFLTLFFIVIIGGLFYFVVEKSIKKHFSINRNKKKQTA